MNFQAGLISVTTHRRQRLQCAPTLTSTTLPLLSLRKSSSLPPPSTNREITHSSSLYPPPSPSFSPLVNESRSSSNPRPQLRPSPMKYEFLLVVVALLASSTVQLVNGDGPNCMQNGMGPQNLYQNGQMNPDYMWSRIGSKIYVPVVMDDTYTDRQLKRILGGFKEIEKKTCVEFHYFNNHTVGNLDHVYVTRQREGCWSYIGRIGGRQEMSLPRGCMSHRTAVHEMIHALGFAHEHVRADRDNYITVHWKNIMPGRERNFVKRKTKSSDPYGPYDYGSIMHYDRGAFSFNGQDTITPKKYGARIGLDERMSHWDKKKINAMYKCGNAYGGGPGGGGGYEGFAPDQNEISNFVDEGYAEGEVDPDVVEHEGDGDGDGHSNAVADGPPSGPGPFGYESSHDDRPAREHSPIQHGHGRSHGHGRPHHQYNHNHVESPVDDDDDYFRPTHGPFPTPNRQSRGRGRGRGHSHGLHDHPRHETPDNYYHRDDEHSPGDGPPRGGGPVQESPFPYGGEEDADTDFDPQSQPQRRPGFRSETNPSPKVHGFSHNGGGGAQSYSHREDNPSSNDRGGRQPTVFDGPQHFFEKCFPFC